MTAEKIVERILFGKGGTKADYAQDIKDFAREECAKQRDVCAEIARGNDPYWVEKKGNAIRESPLVI